MMSGETVDTQTGPRGPENAPDEESRTREALLFMLEDLEENRRAIERAHRDWIASMDAVGDPIVVHDAGHRVLRCNRAYATRAGMEFRDIIGKRYWECFPRREGPLRGCGAAPDKAGPGNHEAPPEEEFTLDTGETFVSRAFPAFGSSGDDVHELHIFENITERKRLRDALERSERHYRKLIEGGSDAFFVIDRTGTLVYRSESGKRLTGWDAEDVLGKPITTYVTREHVPLAMNAIADVIRNPDTLSRVELRLLCKDGSHKDVEAIGKNLLADPDVAGIVVTAHDVTERKRGEEALHASRDLLVSVVEHAPIRVFWKNTELRYLGCNSRFARDAGKSRPEELLGQDDFHMGWRDQAEMYRADDRQVIDSDTPKLGIEEPQSTPDGRTIWLRTSKVPLHRQDGTVIGILGIYDDITEHKNAERALLRLNRALRTLSAGNEVLVRASDESGLLNEMARIFVEVGGYAIAWVGYAMDDPDRRIEPKACVGIDANVLRKARLSWTDNDRGQGVVGSAIRNGEYQIIRNASADPRLAHWAALERPKDAQDALTILGLPLRFQARERPFGALGIGSADPEAFDPEELKLLHELAGDLAYGIANLRAGVERRAADEKLRRSLEGTIEVIAATMESRDPYTAGHQRRVAMLAAAIASEMGLPAQTVEGIHFGALIHDLGKIQVPAEILSKPSKLSKAEFELIKMHPQAGYDIIKGIDLPWPVALMVLQHHERLDGTGYPQGLKPPDIIMEARILAVADVVEAMSSHRPYRPGLGMDAALNEIHKNKGTLFDPAVADACLRLFGEKRFAFEPGN